MNFISRSDGIGVAAYVARKHAAPMCVVISIDPKDSGVELRVDSWGENLRLCAVAGGLAEDIFKFIHQWEPHERQENGSEGTQKVEVEGMEKSRQEREATESENEVT